MNLAAKVRLYMNLCAVEAGSSTTPKLDVGRLRETLGFEIEAQAARLEHVIRESWQPKGQS